MTQIRLTQEAVEVVVAPKPPIRLTQEAVEVVVANVAPSTNGAAVLGAVSTVTAVGSAVVVIAGTAVLNASASCVGVSRIGTMGAATLSGTSTVTGFGTKAQVSRAILEARSSLVARRYLEPTADPGTQRIQYQVIVVDVNGNRYADLENASIESINWELNGDGSMVFTLPVLDAKATHLQFPNREVQVWRGGQIVWWGVLLKATEDSDLMTIQCVGLKWYFKRRLIGKADRTNFITNGSFEEHLGFWDIGVFHSSETAEGRKPQHRFHEQSSLHAAAGNKSLYMEQLNATYPVSGMAASQTFTQTAPAGIYPKGIKMTLAAWCYIPSNKYRGPNGFKQGLVLSRFHATETVTVVGGDGKTGVFPKPIADNIVEINNDTPKDIVLRLEVELVQPPGTTEIIQTRLHCPNGAIWWDEATLTYEEKQGFYDTDQALIVKGLVEHAQDTAFGKSSLAIGTNCPLTGINRTREYIHSEHEIIADSLDEFPSLHQGVDIEVEYTPTTKTFTTYYPRKGMVRRDKVLELGRNIVSFTVDEDGEGTANSIVVLGYGDGSDREEGGAQDTGSLGGLVLEKVYNATPGSSIKTLDEQALRGVQRFKKPVIIPQVTTHEGAGALIGDLRTGDVVPVRINHGRVQVNSDYRIVAITLNPQTDQLTYVLNSAETSF